MREQEFQQIVQQLQSADLEVVKTAYLQEATRYRMPLDLLHSCADLDLTELEKSAARNVRQLKHKSTYRSASSIYFQLNPQKNWSVSAGLIAGGIREEQEVLYWAQTDVLEGRGSDDAARIYFSSLNTPWEETAEAYLVFRTFWTLKQFLKKEQITKQVLVGISHGGLVLCLQKSDIQQQNNINGGDTK